MRLSFLPASNENTASSRIRAFSLQAALSKKNLWARIGYDENTEVLIVQKRVSPEILDHARELKLRGGAVIYDFDDFGPALHYWAPDSLLREILPLADLVTTNTVGFRDLMTSAHAVAGIALIPDIVDYYLDRVVTNPVRSERRLRILWFGNRSNLHLIHKYAATLQRVPDAEIVICTDEHARADVPQHSSFRFEPWRLATFPGILQSSDLSFLPHDGSAADRAKSNNRMITSIAWGVPAIVSRTPEYERTAGMIGYPETTFASHSELEAAIDLMRSPAARSRYLAHAQPIIWSVHSSEAVATHYHQTLRARLRTSGSLATPPPILA